MSLTFSLIIPTYNGAHRLQNLIPLILSMDDKPDEVIIVVDGSTDNSTEVIQSFEGTRSWHVVVTPNQGRSVARNTGSSRASSTHLIFMDDDALFDPGLIRYLKQQYYQEDPEVVITFYPRLTPPSGDWFHQYRLARDARNRTSFAAGREVVPVTFAEFSFTSYLLVMSRPRFTAVGGFDPRLRDNEDYDLGMRLLLQGMQVLCDLRFTTWHNDLQSLQDGIRRQWQYYQARTAVLGVHPEYASLMPAFFQWRQKNRFDGLRNLLFRNTGVWQWCLPQLSRIGWCRPLTYKLTDALIHTQSILKLRR